MTAQTEGGLLRRALLSKPPWVSSASGTLLIGLTLLLFCWIPGPVYRLERFDLPKDFVLGVLGMVCALQVLLHDEVPWEATVDAPLAICLAWGAVLTLAVAINADLAWRTIGGFCAAASIFVLARRVGARGHANHVYLAICIILFAFAALVVLEAFGGMPFISTPGRRPGATLGNRNLAARVACLSLPLLWRQLVVSDRTAIRRALPIMVVVVMAAIVLSRSRGVFLVTAGLVVVILAATWWPSESPLAKRARTASRWWVAAVLTGAVLATLLPNQLGWGAADFADSARSTLEYQSGTGRGRVIQAQTTWRMIRAAPLVGVGPGNWSIDYTAFARTGDPSVQAGAYYPAPQIPRNDVLSFTAEFGVAGILLCLVSAVALFARIIVMLRSRDALRKHSGLMLLTIGGAAALLGLFDSVVRVAPTVGLLALMMGLAVGEDAGRTERSRKSISLGRQFGLQAIFVGYACASLVLARGALQDITAFRIIGSLRTIGDFYRAAAAAPNNVEARMLLAYMLSGANRCELAQPHLTQAALLQPFSGAVRRLQVKCDETVRKP